MARVRPRQDLLGGLAVQPSRDAVARRRVAQALRPQLEGLRVPHVGPVHRAAAEGAKAPAGHAQGARPRAERARTRMWRRRRRARRRRARQQLTHRTSHLPPPQDQKLVPQTIVVELAHPTMPWAFTLPCGGPHMLPISTLLRLLADQSTPLGRACGGHVLITECAAASTAAAPPARRFSTAAARRRLALAAAAFARAAFARARRRLAAAAVTAAARRRRRLRARRLRARAAAITAPPPSPPPPRRHHHHRPAAITTAASPPPPPSRALPPHRHRRRHRSHLSFLARAAATARSWRSEASIRRELASSARI